MDVATAPLPDIVREAWKLGRRIDLTGIGYGRVHWGNNTDIVTNPFPYYFFLAGMARLIDAMSVIELGTHQGGSTRALAAGANPAGRVTTFDVSPDGAAIFKSHPTITAHTLDANSEAAISLCLVQGRPDLVYVDALHQFWPTLQNFVLYGEFLQARFILLDDIHLTPGMDRFWDAVLARFGDEAIDAAEVEPKIRQPGTANVQAPGFGVVRCRK